MSIDGMWEKYGDKYILNHTDGNRYVRWGKIEEDLDFLPTVEAKLLVAAEDMGRAKEVLKKIANPYYENKNYFVLGEKVHDILYEDYLKQLENKDE